MIKEMPVITIHIESEMKNQLIEIAKRQNLQLATFCRLVLINEIKKGEGK